MKQRINSIVLTATLVIFAIVAFSATASAAIINVPSAGNETIQQAINNASAGDTILVNATAYNMQGTPETVVVNKSDIIIRSVSGRAVVSASSSPDKHVFDIRNQTNVTLEGFEMRDAYDMSQGVAGIYMFNASECNISDNTVTNISATEYDAYGIYLYSSSNNNTLTNNTASNNGDGILLYSSSNNNTLTNNTASSNTDGGISLDDSSSNNNLTSNTASNNGDGILLYSSSNNNTLTNNTASNNTNYDFYSDASSHDNTVKDLTVASYPTTLSFTYKNGVGLKGVETGTAPPDPAGKTNIGKYVNATNVTVNSWLFLNVSYEDVDLGGVDENSLSMWKHNGTDWTEVPGTNGTNTTENYVYANITEFGSIFAPLGKPPVNCTCGDICVNTSGWWRDGGAFNLNNTPIQAAIDNATVGETICVKNGTYNETVDVNKTINLTGAGKDTTTIDGTGGSTNTVNITAEGVEIHGFNVTGNASHHGIYVTAAGFNIHDNEFYSDTGSGYAILVNITRENVGSTSLDDMDIRDNYLHGGRGIRFDSIWFDTPDPGSDIVVGNITISGNEIVIQSGYGISMELYLESMNGGNVTWHDTMVVNNTIAAPEGINFYGGLWNLTEVNAAVGDFVFDENIINATGGTGLDIGWWDIYNIHGNTSVTVGRTTVLNNSIECTDDGIAFWFDYLEQYYNQTTISIDDFIVTGNNITANGTGADGIYFDGEIGTMDPGTDAQLGNFTFSHNTINATEEGIYFYIYSPDTSLSRFGDLTVTNNIVNSSSGTAALDIEPLDMYVNEGVDITVGDVTISDNVIHESGGEGIYFWSGFYDLTNGSLTIGDLDISRNIIDPPTIGIDIDWWEFYNIHGTTSITTGTTTVLNNSIECTDDGIAFWFDYLEQYYNQTTISIDDFIVTGNNITANGTGADGIYFDGEIGTMDPGTDAQLGNFTFSHNTINATEEGIYFYIYSPDTSLSRFGDLTVTNNIVNSSSGTAALDIEPLDMYVNEGVDITVGDVTISDNVIHESGGEGIYFWSEFYDLTNGSLTIGDLDISRNIIDPPTIGIDIDWWEIYNIHGNTSVTVGRTTVLNNSIECTDDGIAFWFDYLEQYYNQTTISIDDFIVTGNNITANGTGADGIYFDGEIGTMDPGTDAQLGNFTFSHNTINATEEGIYFYIYSPDTSLSRFGDLTVTNNIVNSSSGTAALDIEPLDMYVNEGVDITVGDVTISDNVIHESGGEGIYFWSEFYDLTNGSLTIGDLDISRNIIDPPTIGIDIDWWEIYNIHGNTSVTVGRTTVLNNSIECTDDGIAFWFDYLEQYYNQTTISIDDFIVTGNNITANGTGADGIYFDGEIGTMDPGTDAQLGNFTFSHNTINATEEGIYFYIYSPDTSLSRFGDLTVTNNIVNSSSGTAALDIEPLDMYVNEGVDITVGDVTISDNVIHESGGEGIYFWSGFYDLTNGSLTIGDLDISRNIIDPPTIGIDIDWWDIYNIHGNTSITTGTTTVLNNSIECTDDGIAFWLDYLEQYYNQTTISIDDFIVTGNNITANGTGADGIYFDGEIGTMDPGTDAQLGNFTFSHNTINATEEGIYFYIYSPDTSLSRFGDLTVTNNIVNSSSGTAALDIEPLDMYVNEGVDITVGDVTISDNVIHESGGEGIYFWSEFYDLTNGSLTIGDLDISRNIIDPPTIGIDIDWWEIYNIHGNTSVTVGRTTVLNNSIECTDDGIAFWFDYLEQYYNQTTISIDDFIVTGNNITANGTGADGIYFDGEIGTMDPGTDAQLGNFTFSHNTINATEEGIYFYIYSPDTSLSRFGDLTVTNNIVNSSSGTAALDIEPLDMYVNEGVDITVGDVTISDNVIHESGGEGIYFWSGFYDLTNGSLTIGDLDISRNIIDPPTIGIDIDWWDIYNIHGNTSITTGTTTVLNNSIECTDDGIAFWLDYIGPLYDQTTISISDVIVEGNSISCVNGLNVEVDVTSRESGNVTMGSFEFIGNDIRNCTLDGLYLNYTLSAYNSSTIAVEGAVIENNTIDNCSGVGINLSALVSHDTGAVATLGNATVTYNTISNNSHGVYLDGGLGVLINRNNIYSNTLYGVFNTQNETVDARCNWWGTVNGPTHPNNTFNVGSQGDNVSDYVDFIPWLNAPYPSGICQWEHVENRDTGEFFFSIQTAIDDPDTLNGHTIKVSDRTFSENVVVNKEVLIVGDPILDAMGGIGFWVQANHTLIENFTVMNCSKAFYVHNASFIVQNVTLRNHTITDCSRTAIEFESVNGSVVGEVTVDDIVNLTGDAYGILLRNSNNNLFHTGSISNITASTWWDLGLCENSVGNTITHYTISSYPTNISFTCGNGVMIKSVDVAPPNPSGKTNIGKYVNATNVTANSWLFLNVSYNESDLGGVDEATLKMYRYNGTSGDWELADGSGINGVNQVANHVYANLTEFSVFAPLGNVMEAPSNITSFAPLSPVNDTVCTWRTFNVTVNQTVNVSWYLNNTPLHTNVSTKEANCTLHAQFVGDNNVSAVATNANATDMQTWIWNVTAAPVFGVPNITSFAPPSPVNDTVCTWRTFNVTVNQTVNVSWYLNESFQFKNESVTEANCTLHAEFVGDNNVSAVAMNANGTDMQTWIWNVTEAPSPAPSNITSFAPLSPVNDTVCTWRTFNVTVNQTVNVSWYLNNTPLHTNVSTKEANCTLHAQFVGDNNVSAVATNANATDMQTWIWNVAEAPTSPLNLSKTDDVGDCAKVGDTITYRICYDNPNSAAVHNVVINDTLPAGVNFVSASDDWSYNPSTRTVTWTIGDLSAGAAEACVTLKVVAYAGTWGTTLENCARINSDETDPTEAYEETDVCVREPRPPMPVPAFTPPGITALIGLLALAGFVMMRRRE